MKPDFDVLIVGGGMVGASLAMALSATGLKLAVIEAFSLDSRSQPSYDDRVIALAWGSRLIMEGLGLWAGIRHEAEAIKRIHVSDCGHFGFTHLSCEEEGVPALGYVIAARSMGQLFARKLTAAPNIELMCPARLVGCTAGEDYVEVIVAADDGERRLSAALAVGADGGNSAVRRALDIPVREWRYGQAAIIANLTPARHHGGVAFERFTASGPLAMLPMTEGRCSLVLTVKDQDANNITTLGDEEFIKLVQDRFGFRLGRFEKVGERSAYELVNRQVEADIRPRAVLIGNAAHTVHPVAGQGFNLGLRDAATLAEVVADAVMAGKDPGEIETLERYAAWRRPDRRTVSQITDGLARLFSNPLLPVRVIRNLGLVGLDLMPSAKHGMARRFMGLGGRLPRLARGLPIV